MKSFTEFLTESKKTYQFRIKIAGELKDDAMDKLEAGLERFGLCSITKPKTTPIQLNPNDFPTLNAIAVSIVDAETEYPATPQEITGVILAACHCGEDHIKVTLANDPNEAEKEEQSQRVETDYEVQLTAPYPKSDKNLPYGQKFIDKFLKDQKNKNVLKVAGGKTAKAETTNDLPQGKVSPVGTNKNVLPKIKG